MHVARSCRSISLKGFRNTAWGKCGRLRDGTPLAPRTSISTRLQCAPDVAFALDPRASPRVDDVLRPLGGLRFGVLVPRSYHHADPSRDARLTTELVRFGRAALDAGLVDRIMVFAQCIGPTAIEDDRIIAARIAAVDDRFVLVDDDLCPAETAELYRHADLVVAVRLHAIILALSVGVPVHGIEYFTAKTSGVFAALGLDRHWSTFDGFDADVALARVGELSSPEGRALIRERARRMRDGVLAIDLTSLLAAAEPSGLVARA